MQGWTPPAGPAARSRAILDARELRDLLPSLTSYQRLGIRKPVGLACSDTLHELDQTNDLCVRRELRRALARVSRSSAGLAVKIAQQAATLALDLTFFIVALPPTRLCPSRRHHIASRTDLKN